MFFNEVRPCAYILGAMTTDAPPINSSYTGIRAPPRQRRRSHHLHSAARAEVGVGEVTWDDTVAAFAQSWAEHLAGDGGCGFQHSSGSGHGENLLGGPGGDWSAADAVGAWVAEKQWYDHDSNSCSAPEGDTCLHYTQVVWRDSTAIGCGRTACDGDAGGFIISCNYNPPGNWVGESPY